MSLVKITDSLFVPENFAESHHYYADENGEKEYTGVTTIINQTIAKPALIGWAAKMACEYIAEKSVFHESENWYRVDVDTLVEARTAHTKKKEAAGEHGTNRHALVESWINECLEKEEGNPICAYLSADDPIYLFKLWAAENVDHFLFSERRMSNKEHWIAGTCDFAYVGKDGKRYIADYKTSSGIYGLDYFLQCAAYRLLAESEGDAPYDGCVVVRQGKNGDFEVQQRFDYETDREAFLAALKLYRAMSTYKANK